MTPAATLTYAELDDRVRVRRDELGTGRRLVMVSGANSVEPLVTYLAALSGGHPVLLVAGDHTEPSQERHRQSLIQRYDPDVVLAPDGDEWQLQERREGTAHALHSELALLLSTSGSSGSPKLVRLSRDNVLSNARSIADYLNLTPRDRAATTLPMHYSYGLSVVNSHLLSGASLLLTERSVVEPEFWDEFETAGATSFAGVPYTFELLDSTDFARRNLPMLRYVTQAGGRLGVEGVRRYARLGRERGFDFIVMYGQTEATARMAYLPPHLAETHPESIGIPIPGGHFRIDTGGLGTAGAGTAGTGTVDDGTADQAAVGELVYTGPNVMMGYAEKPGELADGKSVTELRTGDLARQRDDGLFEIVGRSSRFVKIYGLRIDLDRVERILAEEGIAARAVNLDERLVVFVKEEWFLGLAAPIVAESLGLPRHRVRVHLVDTFPVTANGKPDVQGLLALAATIEANSPAETQGAATAENIRALYATILDRSDASLDDSFVALRGDSLDYVEVSVRLEQMLGALPQDWPTRSPRELAANDTEAVPARSKRWVAVMETPLVLRAVAIVLITATHANLMNIQGGAHLLLGILGFNLARFQFADVPRRSRLRNLAHSAGQIFAPAVLWIGAVALLGGAYEPSTVFMLNGVLGDGDRWSVQWQYWFLEAVLWTILGLVALFAIPLIDRLERRYPFVFAGSLVVLALTLRVLVAGGIQAGPTERYSLPVVLWLIALGWLIARSTDLRRRLVSATVIVLTIPGFFGDPLREGIVLVGLLVLLWLPAIAVPRILVPALGIVASASLFIYLVHWQVYPALEDEFPLLATLASFAVGILAWRGYSAASSWTSSRVAAVGRRIVTKMSGASRRA